MLAAECTSKPSKKGLFAIGNLRALRKRMAQMQAQQTPLETLVVSQMAVIRRREKALQLRLTSGVAGETETVAADLWSLRQSADRLDRMIEAMSFVS